MVQYSFFRELIQDGTVESYLWPPPLKSSSKFQVPLTSLGTGKWFESPGGLSRLWVLGGTQNSKLEKGEEGDGVDI